MKRASERQKKKIEQRVVKQRQRTESGESRTKNQKRKESEKKLLKLIREQGKSVGPQSKGFQLNLLIRLYKRKETQTRNETDPKPNLGQWQGEFLAYYFVLRAGTWMDELGLANRFDVAEVLGHKLTKRGRRRKGGEKKWICGFEFQSWAIRKCRSGGKKASGDAKATNRNPRRRKMPRARR